MSAAGLKILDENIGQNYDEVTMGCLSPLYLLHPELPKYEFTLDIDYILEKMQEYFEETTFGEARDGDLVMIKIREDNHFGIFKSPDSIYHCTKNSKLRLSKIDLYEKYIVKIYALKTKGRK